MKKVNSNKFLYESLRPYIRDKKTLDVGCGTGAYSDVSNNTTRLDRVEAISPDFLVDLEKEDLPFGQGDFECILLFEILDRLPRGRAARILQQCHSICSGRVYVLVPLWNDPSIHKSSWSESDFEGWTRIEFGNYFFGYSEFEGNAPHLPVADPDPEPADGERKPSESAQIRSTYGYKNSWDY